LTVDDPRPRGAIVGGLMCGKKRERGTGEHCEGECEDGDRPLSPSPPAPRGGTPSGVGRGGSGQGSILEAWSAGPHRAALGAGGSVFAEEMNERRT
jgi:hypothetical protein